MSSVWPQLISAAVVGIISPMAIMAAIALLASRHPVTNVLAFLVGWNLVLVALAVVTQLIFGGHRTAVDAGAKAAVSFVLGILLLVFGLRSLVGTQHPLKPSVEHPDQSKGPKWLAEIVDAGPLKSVGFGMLTIAISPGNVAVFLASIQALGGAGIDTTTRVLVTVVLLFVISLAILIPLGIYLAVPRRAHRVLGRLRSWLSEHDRILVAWVSLAFGAVLIVKAITELH
jgi:Sap, sulfolipid-1-addressing protein